MFDCQGGEPGIGDARTPYAGLNGYSCEYRPMPLAGSYDLAMRLVQQIVAIGEGFVDRAGALEEFVD